MTRKEMSSEKKKRLYVYQGNVKLFDRVIGKYKAETWAVSEKKAAQNIAYRYRLENGFAQNARISLVGKPVVKE